MSAIRISIGNLAWFAKCVLLNKVHQFGILNPSKLKKGERQYMALGGGAMLLEAGKAVLERLFSASNFEKDEHIGFFDARFQVDEVHLERIFEMFSKPTFDLERDPTLEIMSELSGKEFPGYEGTILDEGGVAFTLPVFLGSVRQRISEAGSDTSSRASSEIPTRRLFRIFKLEMLQPVFEDFERSPMVKLFTEDELRTTHGGGTAGKAADGTPIQNNLFLLKDAL